MHRTQSWDVGVVLSGKIWCVLDGGEEKEVGVGEVVVQRGTIHVSVDLLFARWSLRSVCLEGTCPRLLRNLSLYLYLTC